MQFGENSGAAARVGQSPDVKEWTLPIHSTFRARANHKPCAGPEAMVRTHRHQHQSHDVSHRILLPQHHAFNALLPSRDTGASTFGNPSARAACTYLRRPHHAFTGRGVESWGAT
jgi:hypothetical protein